MTALVEAFAAEPLLAIAAGLAAVGLADAIALTIAWLLRGMK